MMTDKEKLMELLKSWDVPFKVEPPDEYNKHETIQVGTDAFEIVKSDKITGYNGFHTIYEFDPVTGAFVCMGAWE